MWIGGEMYVSMPKSYPLWDLNGRLVEGGHWYLDVHFLPTIVSVVVKHPIKHWAKKDFELPISTGFRPSHEHLLDIGVHGSVDWTSGFTDHKNHVAGKRGRTPLNYPYLQKPSHPIRSNNLLEFRYIKLLQPICWRNGCRKNGLVTIS